MAEATGILGEIVERKKIDVAARLSGMDLESLRAEAESVTPDARASASPAAAGNGSKPFPAVAT